jgi:hypothetical protein
VLSFAVGEPQFGSAQQVGRPLESTDGIVYVPLNIRTLESTSSATSTLKQPIAMEVVDAVVIDGRTLIEAGAHVSAAVSEVRRPGHNRREGKVAITVTSVMAADGRERMVRLATFWQGTGKGLPIFGPCTFPIPADPVGLFRKGSNVVIPKGYVITVALPKDVQEPR